MCLAIFQTGSFEVDMLTKFKTVLDIKPSYIDNITDALRSVAYSAGRGVHPEFMRAIRCVAISFGITEDELRNGTDRVGNLHFQEGIRPNLRSVIEAAGNCDPEFTRAIYAIGTQFGISKADLL